jgi:VWFA-related protein
MRKLRILLLLLAAISPAALASRRVTVSQLEKILTEDTGKSDAEVGQQISDLELTERLSADRFSKLKETLPGEKSGESLQILANRSAFLDLPAADIPSTPPPGFAEQRRIMSLAVGYVTRTIPQLPNFFATRETTHFEDTPLLQSATSSVPYKPLHFVRASSATVLYRNGREEVDTGPGKKTVSTTAGLTTWGVFGPILGTVLVDAARSKLAWSHWEEGEAGAEAVFSYAVPKASSHYEVNYCCTPKDEVEQGLMQPFRQITGYHGEMAINAQDGTILRLTVEADLNSADPITRAALLVEYGPVEIGGKTYICPTKSLSMSIAQEVQYSKDGYHRPLEFAMRPLKTMLNETVFEQYHMFRADARVVPENEADNQANQNNMQGGSTPVPATNPEPSSGEGPVATPEPAPSATPTGPPAAPAGTAVLPPPPAEVLKETKPDSASVQIPVLRTTTRAVLVDVVVTKGNGDPVLGLAKGDFALTENGKPQSIDFFEEHQKTDSAPNAPPALPPMPAGATTNVPPSPPSDAVNVLLLDTLNTEQQDQSYVRQEVLTFLTHMRPGTRVAIFLLGSQLRFVQGFTTDTAVLIAALNDKRNGMKTEKNHTARSRSDEADDAADIAQMEVMQVSGAAIAAIRQVQADSRALNSGARAAMTFEALNYLGHYLGGVPGRKNLIWFSSSFPVIIFPTTEQQQTEKKNGATPGYLDKARATADLFTASRIAVYPINAQGMMTEHITEASVAGEGPEGLAGHAGGQGGDSPMSPYSAGATERAETIHAMEQLASSTGGKAYFNTNDLNAAMQHAINDGSNYYTIGYSPSETKLDGSYRQIDVKLEKGKYKLSYRHGYNADAGPATRATSESNPLTPLLQFGMPDASGVLYGASVKASATQPTSDAKRAGQNAQLKAPTTRFDVDLVVREQDVVLQTDAGGNRTAKILIGLKAYDRAGNAVNWLGDQEILNIKPDQYSSVQKSGFLFHLEIDLPSSAYVHLATAVYDWNSGKAGSLAIRVNADAPSTR